MDETSTYPDDPARGGGFQDDPAGEPGDTPGDLQPNDGFDPLDPNPTEADDQDANDVMPILPGEEDEDDDLVSPGAQPTFPRSTPI